MLGKAVTLLRLALMDYARNNCPYVAAGIAYWALFSLFPLALATISILACIDPSPERHAWAVQSISSVVPVSREYLAELIGDIVEARGTLSVIAGAGMLFAGTAVFSAVRKGINHAWHLGRPPYFLLERAIDLVMLLGFGILAFILVAFTTNVLGFSPAAAVPDWLGGGLVGRILLEAAAFTLTFGVFLLLYRLIPNTRVSWNDVWIGAALGAFLFQALRLLFTRYVADFGSFNLVYGVLGSLMAVMVWAYLASLALLLGAQVCFTYSRLHGSQQVLGVPADLIDPPDPSESRRIGGAPGAALTIARWFLPPRKKRT